MCFKGSVIEFTGYHISYSIHTTKLAIYIFIFFHLCTTSKNTEYHTLDLVQGTLIFYIKLDIWLRFSFVHVSQSMELFSIFVSFSIWCGSSIKCTILTVQFLIFFGQRSIKCCTFLYIILCFVNFTLQIEIFVSKINLLFFFFDSEMHTRWLLLLAILSCQTPKNH